jgi:hypothetical protein
VQCLEVFWVLPEACRDPAGSRKIGAPASVAEGAEMWGFHPVIRFYKESRQTKAAPEWTGSILCELRP